MRKCEFSRWQVTILGLVFGAILMAATQNVRAEEKPAKIEPKTNKVLRHVVIYKFKETTTPAQVQEVVAAFGKLPKQIDAIIGYEHGTNVSPENKSEGFTHAFVVTFRDEADRDKYLVHPAHDEYVKVVRDRREKVIVFDFWAGE